MTAEPITQEAPPKFQAVPIPKDVAQEAKPDSTPKRRGRPPRDPNAPPVQRRGRKPRSLESSIGSALVMVNLPIMMFASGDALDNAEIEALAKAIDAQCQTSPRFRRYVQTALDASSGGQLITVSGIIIARRFARHEFLLPKAADDQLGKIIGSIPQMTVPDGNDGSESEPSTDGTGA